MDADDLRAGYERFLRAATSAAGCDGTDAAGWSVAMVVAHVAANDRLIAGHLSSAIAGMDTAYDNQTVYRAVDLRPILDARPDVDAQIADARASSAELAALVEQLDEGTSSLVFQTIITDGDVVQLNGPVPLAGLLGAQVRVHLPLHTAQIEALAGA
jgi:Mycothiol maleylpyruvate isomerase N-terminal domain